MSKPRPGTGRTKPNNYTQQNIQSIKNLIGNSLKTDKLDKNIFGDNADKIAKIISSASKDRDKPTQLRRFFDVVVRYYQEASREGRLSQKQSLLLHKIKADVAYSVGRKLTTKEFKAFISHSIDLVENLETLENFKLLFEAMLGFYKQYKK